MAAYVRTLVDKDNNQIYPNTTIPAVSNLQSTLDNIVVDAGHTFVLEQSGTNLIITLKNSAGTTLSTSSVNLNQVGTVSNAVYDSANQELDLTFAGGATVSIPVTDIVGGLVPASRKINNQALTSDLTLTGSNIGYDHTTSGLSATTTQGAIDELADEKLNESNAAAEYANNRAYAVGEYCMHDGTMYKCNTEIDANGEVWTPAHWNSISIGAEVNDLKSALAITSRNILDCTFKNAYINASGVYSELTSGVTCASEEEFIPVDPSTEYTMSGDAPNANNANFAVYYFQYTEDKRFISRNDYLYTTATAKGQTITTESNAAFVRFMLYKTNLAWDSIIPNHLQFEKGSTATEYLQPKYVVNTNALVMPELENILEDYFNGKYDFRTCSIVLPATNNLDYRILINESNIVIPVYTRVYFDNNKVFRTTGNTTVNRIAYGSSAENNEILVFDTSDNTFRFVGGSAYDTLTATDRVVALFKFGMNGCTLPESFITWNNVSVENKIGVVALPSYSGAGHNYKIRVNRDTIVLPPYTRILYGKSQQYSTTSFITVDRVAYGSNAPNNEVLLFNTSTKAFRFVNGNMSTPIDRNEVILATFKWELDGCSLSPDYVEYETEIVKNNPQAGILLNNASIAIRTEIYNSLAQKHKLLNLIHFSDVHGDTNAIKRILDFNERYGSLIHDIIHTGDGVTTHFEDANPFATVGGNTILNVVGNHEYWKTGATWPYPYNATQTEVYEKFIAPFINNWADVISAGENKNYYYKDYQTANVRMIVLDCVNYDTNQATWFESILSDAITNEIKVICVTHYPPQPGITPIDCNFTTTETLPGTQADPPAGTQIEFMPTAAYQAVDDFIDGGGDFICWLSGHMHKDAIGKVTSYTNQLLVFISTANRVANLDVVARNAGTKLEDLFNIFTFDGDSDVIKIIRIGADYDKFLRHRGTIVINYKTQTIVSSD